MIMLPESPSNIICVADVEFIGRNIMQNIYNILHWLWVPTLSGYFFSTPPFHADQICRFFTQYVYW